MHSYVGVLLGALLLTCGVSGQEKTERETRYGIAVDLKTYPQSTAKEALASILKAIEAKRLDYVVAQLADPDFVDERVKRLYGGRFEEQVEDTRARLDPFTVKQLQRFHKDGDWKGDDKRVTVRLKDNERCLHFTNKNGRWFLQHDSKPTSP
jgi:hypothetical protein